MSNSTIAPTTRARSSTARRSRSAVGRRRGDDLRRGPDDRPRRCWPAPQRSTTCSSRPEAPGRRPAATTRSSSGTSTGSTGRWSVRETLTGHAGGIVGIEFDPATSTLLTAGKDGYVISWDLSPDAGFGSTYPGLDNRWVSNRPQLIGDSGVMVEPTRPLHGYLRRPRAELAAVDRRRRDIRRRHQRAGRRPGASWPDRRRFHVRLVGVRRPRRPLDRGDLWLCDHDPRRDNSRHRRARRSPAGGPSRRGRDGVGHGLDPRRKQAVARRGGSTGSHRRRRHRRRRPGRLEVESTIPFPGAPQTFTASPSRRLLAVSSELGSQVRIIDPVTLKTLHVLDLGDNDNAYDMAFSPRRALARRGWKTR